MTDVRDGGGTRGPRMWDEPGQDLDELLTRWGADQSGPYRRPAPAGGRHAAPEATASGDDLLPTPPSYRRPAAPAPRSPVPPPAAGPRAGRDVFPGGSEHPSWPGQDVPPLDSGRRRDVPPADPGRRRDVPPADPGRRRDVPPADPGRRRDVPPAGSGHRAWSERGVPAARTEHPSWPGTGHPSWPGRTPAPAEHPSWPSSGLPGGGPAAWSGAPGGPAAWSGAPGGPAAWSGAPGGGSAARSGAPGGRPEAGEPAPIGRRHRPDGVPPTWDPAAAPNGGRPGTPPAAALVAGPAGPAGPADPPRFDDTGAYAGWLSGPARPGPVGVLERDGDRIPDRYGLLTHDVDGYVTPDPADWEDETPGRHRRAGARPARSLRPRWLRTLRWVGLSLAALLLLGGGFGVYQYRKLSGNINRIDALAPGDASIRDAGKQLDAENYLLIGSDTRAGANGQYEEAAGQVSGQRSDTTILAHLSPDRAKATLVSFPRDSWVSLPECRKPDGTVEPAHEGQFNEAFSIGGPSCTVLAVQKLTGIKINHYVQVDFTGFKTMVDAVGGVPICTPVPLRDRESGLRMDPGTTRLKGEQALAYVRARYGIGNGSDLGRIERQQRFLGAMVRSATSAKLLVNPVALTKFLGAATKSLTLDKETSFGDLKALADQLNGLDPKKVGFLTAPIADPAYNPPGFPPLRPGQGGSKVLLDDVAGRTLWDSIINDKPAQPGGATPAPKQQDVLTVAPAEVTVRVLNGVGTGGLATTVGTALQGAGFSLVEPTNAPRTATTTVRYAPNRAAEARTLAAAVPGAVLQPDAGTTLDLVVGANYTGVRTVKVGDPATAKAAPAPKPAKPAATAKPVTAADATCT